jgi:hypothetical protein
VPLTAKAGIGRAGLIVVLVPSPLLGPFSWSAVANELRLHGTQAIVPILSDDNDSSDPYWHQHAESVKRALAPVSRERALTLVGHSGAGPLLPAVRQLTGRPAAAYLFVDAGIPRDGEPRMGSADSDFARYLRPLLENGGTWPEWSADDLREVLPSEEVRRRLIAELRPRPLRFWTEPIPVFAAWPDAPCGYLLFSEVYEREARRAREAGWPVRTLRGGHFHQLVEPSAVAEELLALAGAASRAGNPD